MPTYNSHQWISKLYPICIRTNYEQWELLIVDDGSTDNTKNIVMDFLNDKRIKYYYQENYGPATARNFGISKASGKYLAFLDSDDLWKPNKLELQLNHLKKNPDCCLIHTNYSIFESNTQNSKPFRQTLLVFKLG